MCSDEYYIGFVKDTRFLGDETKNMYVKKLRIIQTEFWETSRTIHYILQNPEDFYAKMMQFAANKKGRQNDTVGDHWKDGYFSAVVALFRYNQELKESEFELFGKWKKLQEEVRKPISDKYKSNEPTEKQRDAYVPFDELLKTQALLETGSLQKLLLMMYTEIPPVRNDYHQTKIVREIPSDMDAFDNFIVLSDEKPVIILQKYKTAAVYGMLVIDIPPKLQKEIELSLVKMPRDHLFVSTRTGKPYDLEGTFNTWANRALKNMFGKTNFSLTTLRHIYISRRDLMLEERSGLDQEKIAKLMGHSIEQQRKYLWHSWLRKIEAPPKLGNI